MSKRKEGGGCRLPVLGLLGLIVSIAGLYLGYDQWQKAQSTEESNRPNVVLCLRDFEYHTARTFTSSGNLHHVPAGTASFRLVNTGSSEVTVSRVSFNPTGTWKDGRPGGLGSFDARISERVAGNGVATVNNLAFDSNVGIKDQFWFDDPEAVNVKADWPGGSSDWITCLPSSFSGGWSCGNASRNDAGQIMSVSVHSACQ